MHDPANLPPESRPAATPVEAVSNVDPRAVPEFDTRELMRGNREIWIVHHGERYRLSITRNDKLILHK